MERDEEGYTPHVAFYYWLVEASESVANGCTLDRPSDGSPPLVLPPEVCHECGKGFKVGEVIVLEPMEMCDDRYHHVRCVVRKMNEKFNKVSEFMGKVRAYAGQGR
jgi:hypothetical protein